MSSYVSFSNVYTGYSVNNTYSTLIIYYRLIYDVKCVYLIFVFMQQLLFRLLAYINVIYIYIYTFV